MSKKERTHEYLCEHVLDEYVTGICDGKRFCFRVDSIKKLTQDGIAIADGEKDGWWVFLLWEELERMFNGEAIAVRAEATYHGSYDGYSIKECRFVRSDESLEDIERECEKERMYGYVNEPVLEEDVQATREFLEEKGLLTDCTEDDGLQEETTEQERPAVWRGSSEVRRDAIIDDMVRNGHERAWEALNGKQTERKGSDIVRECREAIENAFSDMIWDLSEHPSRPSLVVEAHEEKGRLLTALGNLEEYYCITEGTEVAQ